MTIALERKAKSTVLRLGRRRVGRIVKQYVEIRVYVSDRSSKNVYRGGCTSVIEAMHEHKAAFAIDLEVLGHLQENDVKLILIKYKTPKDKIVEFRASLEHWLRKGRKEHVTGQRAQRMLRFDEFSLVSSGETGLPVDPWTGKDIP